MTTWILNLNPFEQAILLSALWGFFYNIVNHYFEKTGFNDLYRPATIALGVAVELAIIWPAIGWEAGLIAIAGFVVAGTSMVAGGFVGILKALQRPKSIKSLFLEQQLERTRRAMAQERVADEEPK